MEGPLSKWTNVMKGWQYRWFVLDDNAGLFSYYTSRDKMVRGVRRGCVRLKGAVIGIDDEDEATFTITVDGKTFHFQAQDSEERERWIRALEDTVLRHNQIRRSSTRKGFGLGSMSGQVSIEDFDRKLSETDAYLELLLKQVSKLKEKSLDPQAASDVKERYEGIVNKAQEMTESLKHAIILLQIAKNAALPPEATSGSVKDFSNAVLVPKIPDIQNLKLNSTGEASSSVDSDLDVRPSQDLPDPNRPLEQDCKDSAPKLDRSPRNLVPMITKQGLKPDKSSAIPEISYSSSDDDDFFDAEENDDGKVEVAANRVATSPVIASSAPPMPPEGFSLPLVPKEGSALSEEESSDDLKSPMTPSDIDFDALYEEEESGDVDMKSHGSVITHLLSQVRIGMDLTKIVLPTFILERRSLLEMYSDFFAHPDLFIGIADGNNAEDRMVRVLRWYLSSFHAGRKSSIAKKPYNPIIGETFRCHWKIEEKKEGAKVNDGPLPWCHENDLTFIAEQVSHHPPISAFYAEHPSKRISVNAHIYTKSSFLGMSVAVHNVGQGKLYLLDHDEEYICTFPSGYGRSILTVPWIELGGKVSLACPKTNYVANIEFKCKQFFSSDVNKIAAEVFAPNSKKPFLKVEGEWNGRMMAKWASGKNEVFIDVTKIPIYPKICKKVADQGRFESRRLWKDVTYNLKINNIDAATASKFALEQRQREEAAERKDRGVKWETKLFKPIGENWQYIAPLEKRRTS